MQSLSSKSSTEDGWYVSLSLSLLHPLLVSLSVLQKSSTIPVPILQARVELRRLKYLKKVAWAVGIIKKYFDGWQARKAVREMKYQKRVEVATVVLQKYCRGWKVSCVHV